MTRPPLPRPGSLGLIQYAGVDMHAYADACVAAETAALRERIKVLEDALDVKYLRRILKPGRINNDA